LGKSDQAYRSDTTYLLRIYVLLLLFALAVAAPHSSIAAVCFQFEELKHIE
jgi:hypothetical protein